MKDDSQFNHARRNSLQSATAGRLTAEVEAGGKRDSDGTPQCPAARVVTLPATTEHSLDSLEGGAHESSASKQNSVAALAPAATPFTHQICHRCNKVLRGNPKTVSRVGAYVDVTGICETCQSNAIETQAQETEFPQTVLRGIALRHFEMAKKLRAIDQPGLADLEQKAGERAMNEADAVSLQEP